MGSRPALKMPIRAEAFHLLSAGAFHPVLEVFIDNLSEEMLEQVVSSANRNYVAQLVLSRVVHNTDWGFEMDAPASEQRKQWCHSLLQAYCAATDWYPHFDYLSIDDITTTVESIHREIMVSTNDFSTAAVKAKFAIHHWKLDRWVNHDEYTQMYEFLVENIELVDHRIDRLADGSSREFDEFKALLEVPVCLQDGIL